MEFEGVYCQPKPEPVVYLDNAEDPVDDSTDKDVNLSSLGINDLKEIPEINAQSQLYGVEKLTDILDSGRFQNSSSEHRMWKGHKGICEEETVKLNKLESNLCEADTVVQKDMLSMTVTKTEIEKDDDIVSSVGVKQEFQSLFRLKREIKTDDNIVNDITSEKEEIYSEPDSQCDQQVEAVVDNTYDGMYTDVSLCDNNVCADRLMVNSSNVTAHENISAEEEFHMCGYCDVDFAYSSELQKHDKTDRKERLQSCDFCTKRSESVAEELEQLITSDADKMDIEMSDTERDAESDIEIGDPDDALSELESNDGNAAAGAAAGDGTDTWKTEASNITVLDYPHQSGPQHSLGAGACPLDFFWLMFPLALMNIIVEETNRYAHQCMATVPNSSWYDTCIDEMRAFLGIQIIFGIRQLPRLWCYWSQDHRYKDPWVSSIMPINRYKNLSRYLHCRDTANQPQHGENGFDPLFKVRNIIDVTQETFKKYFLAGRELGIDECMVGFKGRLSFKQYMPAKPTEWGIKIWTICDAKTAFCLGYDVYTGKLGRRDPCKPLVFEVVDSLSAPFVKKGHHIYIDRFFNSVDIANHLVTNHTYMCGTIMTNRKGLPPAMKKKLKNKGDLLQLQKGNLIATSYHDKRTICLLSSNQIMGRAEDGRPHQLIDYNKFTGGVDKFDQQLSYYPVGRPGKKWWWYLLWHVINASVYNAFICWSQSPHSYDICKGYGHLEFRTDVAGALINGYTSRKLPGRPATKQEMVAPESIKHHVLSKISGRAKQCVLCSMESRKTPKGYPVETSWRCRFCEVALCKRVCFGRYHEVGLALNGASR